LIHRSIGIYRGKIESHERWAGRVQGNDSPALRFAFHTVHRKDIRYSWVAYPAGSSYRSKIEQSVFPSVPLPFAILYVSSSRNVAVLFFTSSLARVVKIGDWRILVAFAFSNPVCRSGLHAGDLSATSKDKCCWNERVTRALKILFFVITYISNFKCHFLKFIITLNRNSCILII